MNSNTLEYKHPVQQGWECPRCHVINAPFITQCQCPLVWNTFQPVVDPFWVDGVPN